MSTPAQTGDVDRQSFRAWFVQWAPNVAVVAITASVGAVAAVISYAHQHALNLAHEAAATDWTAKYWPVTVEGIVLAAGLVLVIRRRAGRPGGVIVWAAMLVGAAVTLAANVASAAIDPRTGEPDRVGQLMNAWPPAAFLFAVELLVIAFRPWSTGPVPDRSEPMRDRTPAQTLTTRPQRSRMAALARFLVAPVRVALVCWAWLAERPTGPVPAEKPDGDRADGSGPDEQADERDRAHSDRDRADDEQQDRQADRPTRPVDTNNTNAELVADLVLWAVERRGPVPRSEAMRAYGIGRTRWDSLQAQRDGADSASNTATGPDRSRPASGK